jgi:hypothetical protein
MPTGSFDLDYMPAALSSPALHIYVARYTGGDTYTLLSNVVCLKIDVKEGPSPPLAQFSYLTGDALEANLGWPSQFEDLWPVDALSDYTVMTDDRLVVLTSDPSGSRVVLFDGFAQIPQVDLSKATQSVTFVAVGVATRLWDTPIIGRIQRSGAIPATTDGSLDFAVDLPCHFNPSSTVPGSVAGYIGNCVFEDNFTVNPDAGPDNASGYPVFIEPMIIERDDDETSYWFVSDAVKYLLATEASPTDEVDNPYVAYPSLGALNAILSCYEPPNNGDGSLSATSATTVDIKIRSYDASNKPMPEALSELLNYGGFLMTFVTSTSGDGFPLTELHILRRDALASTDPKPVFLAVANSGNDLDPTQNNVTEIHLSRDLNTVVNAWKVESQLRKVEATFYLAPLFQPNNGDQADCKPYFKSKLQNATATLQRAYRWYGVDEVADGHWNAVDQVWDMTPSDMSLLFPNDDDDQQSYVSRYRPGSHKMISKDSKGKPLARATLEIMFGVNSTATPGPVDTTAGTWLAITHGWHLLPDRLGIEVDCENPEEWHTGNPAVGQAGKIAGITWQALPPSTPVDRKFALRLTTVIDDDFKMPIIADKRTASPTRFARMRAADAKDHFEYHTIAVQSIHYTAQGGNGTDPFVMRDDTKAAQTHADQLRAAHEFPPTAGSITVPFVTDFYQIGDRILEVQGRDANLQTNIGIDQGETPAYPWVIGYTWILEESKQSTVLKLSDKRAEVRNL